MGCIEPSLLQNASKIESSSVIKGRYSEAASGLGRPDALLIPKPNHGQQALVLEYKVAKEAADLERVAQAGLRQIQEKDYRAKVGAHTHVRSVLQVSLGFCGKEVAVLHERVEL